MALVPCDEPAGKNLLVFNGIYIHTYIKGKVLRVAVWVEKVKWGWRIYTRSIFHPPVYIFVLALVIVHRLAPHHLHHLHQQPPLSFHLSIYLFHYLLLFFFFCFLYGAKLLFLFFILFISLFFSLSFVWCVNLQLYEIQHQADDPMMQVKLHISFKFLFFTFEFIYFTCMSTRS